MAADEGQPVWLISKQLNWSEQSFKESLSSLRGISLQVLDIGLQSKPRKTFQQTCKVLVHSIWGKEFYETSMYRNPIILWNHLTYLLLYSQVNLDTVSDPVYIIITGR